MKKVHALIVILVILIIGIIYLNLPKKPSCEILEQEINGLLDEVNYCNIDTDCKFSARYQCPFGCYQFHNKDADFSVIDEKVEEYTNNPCPFCMLACLEPPTQEDVKCREGKCVDARLKP